MSCGDTSINVVKPVEANLYQAGGCQSHSLSKVSSINNRFVKISSSDTTFSYKFKDTLYVNFLAFADCSLKSDIFYVSYIIKVDTIFVTAIDTAKNFSNCTCGYPIKAEFKNLPLDHYVFYGIVCPSEGMIYTFSEDIYREAEN
jgi:hypothetical protein